MPWRVDIQIAKPYLVPGTRPWLRAIVRQALAGRPEPPGAVGLVITGEEEVQELNRRFRGVDLPTDVLAFPFRDGETFPPSPENPLGEVIISLPRAQAQAREYGHPLRQELALLVVHGLLHLLGFRDDRPQEEEKMRQEEARLMACLKELY